MLGLGILQSYSWLSSNKVTCISDGWQLWFLVGIPSGCLSSAPAVGFVAPRVQNNASRFNHDINAAYLLFIGWPQLLYDQTGACSSWQSFKGKEVKGWRWRPCNPIMELLMATAELLNHHVTAMGVKDQPTGWFTDASLSCRLPQHLSYSHYSDFRGIACLQTYDS